MESALNDAHQQQRRAESCLRGGKFENAIACHQKAAELLKDAMKLTSAEKAMESLKLQHDYHIRQQDVVRYKQKHAEKIRLLIQNKKMAAINRCGIEKTISPSDESPENLQYAIYRTMEENDSLLQFLRDKKQQPSTAATTNSSRESSPDVLTNQEEIIRSAVKTPKDDKTIIEELHVNNRVLKELVQGLVTEIDRKNQTIGELQSRLQRIEVTLAAGAKTTTGNGGSNKLNVNTSSPLPGSPPSSELSPVGGARELPPLAPLEMPNFDFNVFNNSDPNSE